MTIYENIIMKYKVTIWCLQTGNRNMYKPHGSLSFYYFLQYNIKWYQSSLFCRILAHGKHMWVSISFHLCLSGGQSHWSNTLLWVIPRVGKPGNHYKVLAIGMLDGGKSGNWGSISLRDIAPCDNRGELSNISEIQ